MKISLNWPIQVTAQTIAHTTVDILLTSEISSLGYILMNFF